MFNYRDFNHVQSIALKFVMLIAPAVTVTANIICVLSGVLSFRSMSADLQKKLDLIVRTNGGAIAEPLLWNIDEEGTRSSLRTVVIHPDILCAAVSDTVWIEVIPVGTRNQPVGRLHLSYTREPIYSQLRRGILFSALLFLLIILVSVGVAYAALTVIVKALLDHLLASIRSTELGTNKPVTHWSSNDEMGTVVTAYNRMIHQVEQHNEELVEARERAERAGASKTRFLSCVPRPMEPRCAGRSAKIPTA